MVGKILPHQQDSNSKLLQTLAVIEASSKNWKIVTISQQRASTELIEKQESEINWMPAFKKTGPTSSFSLLDARNICKGRWRVFKLKGWSRVTKAAQKLTPARQAPKTNAYEVRSALVLRSPRLRLDFFPFGDERLISSLAPIIFLPPLTSEGKPIWMSRDSNLGEEAPQADTINRTIWLDTRGIISYRGESKFKLLKPAVLQTTTASFFVSREFLVEMLPQLWLSGPSF